MLESHISVGKGISYYLINEVDTLEIDSCIHYDGHIFPATNSAISPLSQIRYAAIGLILGIILLP
jgi:hypothetical protein